MIVNEENWRNNTGEDADLEDEIRDSYFALKTNVGSNASLSNLLTSLKYKSFVDKYNYLSLLEKIDSLDDFLKIEHSRHKGQIVLEEVFTKWICDFMPDSLDKVNELISKSRKQPGSKSMAVPKEYLRKNIFGYAFSKPVLKEDNTIIIKEYYARGLLVPETFGCINFSELYCCAPLISRVAGDQRYIAFLHVFSDILDSNIVDEQVKHWMNEMSKVGGIMETLFAPRDSVHFSDTNYIHAVKYIKENSKKTIVFKRKAHELKGVVNKNGVYFKGCGYHLWRAHEGN